MAKHEHEFRDPIHVFIRVNSDERKVVDSRPFQRLRHVHQLAMSYLVYPGATHRRFEHSLGVMELAGRVFDVLTKEENLSEEARKRILPDKDGRGYWRRALRLAALLHDIGHLPFSHAAEHELLPEGWNHEKITQELIEKSEISEVFKGLKPPVDIGDVIKLSVGPQKLPGAKFDEWETLLSEIITGDLFGVDRMDYLLRDAFHCGVAYGRFDHYRLIDCLRILPKSYEQTKELALGIEHGGLHSAEALLLARYFMFTQVYLHPVRRIYDIHLQDFLKQWLEGGRFKPDCESHLRLTDNEVTSAIHEAARTKDAKGHDPARRIVERDHFKLCYSRLPADVKKNPEAAKLIFEALCKQFGDDNVRFAPYGKKGAVSKFPLLQPDGTAVSGLEDSDVFRHFPPTVLEHVFIEPELYTKARDWVDANKEKVLG